MQQPTAPLTFLDHLRASAKPATPEPALAAGKSKQLSNTVQRALLECLGPGLEFEAGAQQLLPVTDWLSSLDASSCVIAQSVEDKPDETALITFDRRTAILLATAQFGGASMLGLTDTGRTVSAIEQEYLTEFGAALFPAIKAGSSGDMPVRYIEPQAAATILPPDCALTVFDFAVKLNDVRLNFVLVTPAEAAQAKSSAPAQTQSESAWKSAIGSELTRSKVRLEAVVELTPLTLSRLRVLLPGDIIPIPEGSLGKTALVSRGETLLTGRLGKFGGSYTVRVTSTASEKATPLEGAIANRGTENRK
jgi:flagellar motor switch protein FliM